MRAVCSAMPLRSRTLRLHDLPPAECEKLLGERSGALRSRLDLLDLGPQSRIGRRRGTRAATGGEPLENETAAAENGGEKVVEVVRHATRQPADRLHFLRLPQLLLEGLAIGDVHRHADRADDRAVDVAQRLDVTGVDPFGPDLLVGAGVSADGAQVRRDGGQLRIVRPEEVEDALADAFSRPHADRRQGAAVGRGINQLAVGRPEKRGELRQQQPQPRLSAGEGVVGELALNGERHLIGNEDQQVEIVGVIADAGRVALHDERADDGAVAQQRDAEPVDRRRADLFDLAALRPDCRRHRAKRAAVGRCAGRIRSGPVPGSLAAADPRADRGNRES